MSEHPDTISYYNRNAAEIARDYESLDMRHTVEPVAAYFPPRGSVLEIGCGSGRDAAYLLQRGFNVTATDGSAAMISAAASHHPELAGRLRRHMLPEPLPFDPGDFDAVISMATLMHLDRADLSSVFTEIHRVLAAHGVVGISVSTERNGLDETGVDAKGRRFTVMPGEQWAALLEAAGFTLEAKWGNRDTTGRAGVAWTTLVGRKTTRSSAQAEGSV